MRKRWIVVGVIVATIGLVALIGGAIATAISRTSSSVDPIAEARTPGTATFEAEAQEYDILLVRARGDSARTAESITCEVTLADGSTVAVDGSVQATSEEVGNIETVGSFDAVAGPTSVFCDADGGDNRFVIDEESTLEKVGFIVLIGGVVVLLMGAGMILGGIFLKKTVPA